MQLMQAIASSVEATFLAYLQPAEAYGVYPPTSGEDYREPDAAALRFLAVAQEAAAELPWCVDLTACLADNNAMFVDGIHLNEEGNAALTRSIIADLDSRGLLIGSADARER